MTRNLEPDVVTMIRAIWNGTVLAEAPRTVRVEGNHYFPPESVRREYFVDSSTKSVCPWKGVAATTRWWWTTNRTPMRRGTTPKPSPLARRIKDHVAFWNGFEAEGEPEEGGPTLANRLSAWLDGNR